jgi:predicted RNA-binding protein with PIN domain
LSSRLADEEHVVLVDARNVMRSRWPNIGEERLLDLMQAWADEERVRVIAVFDGRAPGDEVGTRKLDGGMTIVGTGGGSADDWIAQHAREMAQHGHRLWLLSSDRGLRERVAGNVERVIGGGSFATRLDALGRGP